MIGDIILVDNQKGTLLSKLIKFFTKRAAKRYGVNTFTHAMISVGRIFGDTEEYVISAEPIITIMPLSKFSEYYYETYRLRGITQRELKENVSKIAKQTAGTMYGFFQLLWFVFRWFMELFNVDMRKKRNWFPLGDICSEHTYRFLKLCANSYKESLVFHNLLEEWNENTVSPVDIAYILKVLSIAGYVSRR